MYSLTAPLRWLPTSTCHIDLQRSDVVRAIRAWNFRGQVSREICHPLKICPPEPISQEICPPLRKDSLLHRYKLGHREASSKSVFQYLQLVCIIWFRIRVRVGLQSVCISWFSQKLHLFLGGGGQISCDTGISSVPFGIPLITFVVDLLWFDEVLHVILQPRPGQFHARRCMIILNVQRYNNTENGILN